MTLEPDRQKSQLGNHQMAVLSSGLQANKRETLLHITCDTRIPVTRLIIPAAVQSSCRLACGSCGAVTGTACCSLQLR
jgi:hypothetical protein